MQTAGILDGLNEEQREAVTTTEGPLLIVAGAGTGKTTVIARRIAYIISQKLAAPSEILALTFTDKAAAEMEERVDVLVPYGYVDTKIATFHAFGDEVLRDHALELGITPDFRVMTRPEQILFVKQHLFEFDLDYYRPLSNPYKFIEAMLTLISRAKDADVTPEEYLHYAEQIQGDDEEKKRQLELANFYAQYERLKTEASLLDFGDQIVMTLKLFRLKPQVLAFYQNRYRYILVDEYQDTNFAQNELVKMLAAGHQNICVVGDDDQSIYKFRGAAISNILEFKKTYPQSKQVVLTKNYRSTQPILAAAYRLIQHNNPDRLEVRNEIVKKLVSVRKEKGQPPKLFFANTLSEETDLVAKEIMTLTTEKGLKFADIAILVRANEAAIPFIQALNMRSIPYQFIGSFGLYDRPEIRMLIAFIKNLSTLSDDLSLYYLATSEIYQVPVEEMLKVNDFAKRTNKSLFGVMSDYLKQLNLSHSTQLKIEQLIGDLREGMKLSRKLNAGQVLYYYLQKSGYLKNLVKENSVQAQEKIANIAKFFERISEFSQIAQLDSVQNFASFLEVMRASGENPATAQIDPDLDAVNIITIHSAKGLEFRAVFLVNLVADRFPVRERGDPIMLPTALIKETLPVGDFHLQEERRLFYVGLTRAMDYLYLTYARDYGGKRPKKVSPFVLETLGVAQVAGMPVKASHLEKLAKFTAPPSGQLVFDLSKKKIITEEKVISLSRIEIESYLSCALQYWYSHVARLPVPRNYNLVYGTALHKAVEEFYRYKLRGQLITLEQLEAILEGAWVSEGFLTAEHERASLAKAKQVIAQFYQREAATPLPNVEVEKSFKFTHNNVIVKGRFDYLEKGEKVRILDFKSTEDVGESQALERVKQSIQLKIYALAYYKITGQLPDEMGIYFLDNGLISTVQVEEKHLEEARHAIDVVAIGVRVGNFKANPKEGAFTCQYCSFNRICPAALV